MITIGLQKKIVVKIFVVYSDISQRKYPYYKKIEFGRTQIYFY